MQQMFFFTINNNNKQYATNVLLHNKQQQQTIKHRYRYDSSWSNCGSIGREQKEENNWAHNLVINQVKVK